MSVFAIKLMPRAGPISYDLPERAGSGDKRQDWRVTHGPVVDYRDQWRPLSDRIAALLPSLVASSLELVREPRDDAPLARHSSRLERPRQGELDRVERWRRAACSAYIEYASARLPSLGPRSDLLAPTGSVGSRGKREWGS